MNRLQKEAHIGRLRKQNPRSGDDVRMSFAKNVTQPTSKGYITEGVMLRARCVRMKNRSTVIGKTIFKFDQEGIAAVLDQGHTRNDYEQLLQMNGVSALEEPKAPEPEALPALETYAEIPILSEDKTEDNNSVTIDMAPYKDLDDSFYSTESETKVDKKKQKKFKSS